MATSNQPSLCSNCNKLPSTRFCIGCQKYFCAKDFKEHERQLFMRFDNEVVRYHDELLDQIRILETANYSLSDLLVRIDTWKRKTIEKVEQAAEKAKHELIEQINKEKIDIPKRLNIITKEICSHREEENFCETDIQKLRNKIDGLQRILEKYLGKDTKQYAVIERDEIDWNRMLYVRGRQKICMYIHLIVLREYSVKIILEQRSPFY